MNKSTKSYSTRMTLPFFRAIRNRPEGMHESIIRMEIGGTTGQNYVRTPCAYAYVYFILFVVSRRFENKNLQSEPFWLVFPLTAIKAYNNKHRVGQTSRLYITCITWSSTGIYMQI